MISRSYSKVSTEAETLPLVAADVVLSVSDEPPVATRWCNSFAAGFLTAVLLFFLVIGVLALQLVLAGTLSNAATSVVQSIWRTPLVEHNHPLFERWAPYCNAENFIFDRGELDYSEQRRKDLHRNWTISAETFSSSASPCSNADDLLRAMRWGHREALPGHEMIALSNDTGQAITHDNVEWSQSVFRPYGCSLRWFEDEEQVCAVLNRFSHIVFVGDSLLRHTYQGIFMLLTGDLRYGGLARMSRHQGLFDCCNCDGQFSENKKCREFENANMYVLEDPRIYGLCTQGYEHTFNLQYRDIAIGDIAFMCSNDTRPRVLILQGGSHYASNANSTIEHFIQPILTYVDNVQRECQWKPRWSILWIEYHAQSRVLDATYPHQSREASAKFNADVNAFLAPRNISIFGSWNFTINASSSDGFHFMSDVNLVRANGLVNWMHLHTQNLSSLEDAYR